MAKQVFPLAGCGSTFRRCGPPRRHRRRVWQQPVGGCRPAGNRTGRGMCARGGHRTTEQAFDTRRGDRCEGPRQRRRRRGQAQRPLAHPGRGPVLRGMCGPERTTGRRVREGELQSTRRRRLGRGRRRVCRRPGSTNTTRRQVERHSGSRGTGSSTHGSDPLDLHPREPPGAVPPASPDHEVDARTKAGILPDAQVDGLIRRRSTTFPSGG